MKHHGWADDADFDDIAEREAGDPERSIDRAENRYERQYIATAEDVGAER